MAGTNPFDQFDGPQMVTIGTRDPAKVRAEERAQAAAERSAEASARQAGAAERAATTQERTASNQGKDFILKLAGDYNADPSVKAYRTAIAQFGQALNTGEGPQADLALTYAFAKAMDPESVVRESEQGMVTESQPWFQSAVERVKKQFAMDGAGNFTPEARDALRKQISNSVAQRAKVYDARRGYYEKQAQAIGVDPDVILGQHDASPFVPAIRDWVSRVNGQAPDGQQADNEIDKASALPDPSPSDLPPSNQGGNDPTPLTGASGGGMQDVARPDIASMVRSMIAAGAGFSSVNAALKAKGARTLSFSEFNQAKQGRAIEAHETRPLSLIERAAGSPLGALAANYTNSATAGTAAAIAGDRGEGALDAMQALHPTWSGTGSVLGGITGALGAEAGLAARAPAVLARFAPRAADAVYGGLYGFNQAEDGEGGSGAITGAITGAVGGALGERAMRGVGNVARGIVDPAVQRLRLLGVPLTVGRAVGQSGPIGAAIKKAEEAMVSYPGVGSVVSERFDDGLRGLNRAAFEVGAETTGNQVQDVGSAGLARLHQLVGDTYDTALHPGVRLDVTEPQVAQDIINAQMTAASIPQVGQNAADAIDYRMTGGTGLDGTMSGRDFQEAYRGLGRDGRAANDVYAQEVRGAMGQAQDALAAGLETQNPGAYQGFVAANTANRRAMVLSDAVNAAKNQNSEWFTPAQLNTADANSATRLTGRMNSASGNRPFHQLAQDAQQVIGNRLANSGTADRALTGLAIGGLLGGGAGYAAGDPGTGAGAGLALTLAAMAGGSRPAQRAITAALLDRPAWLRNAGDIIAQNAQIGGWTGAGVLTPLLVNSQ